MEQVVAIEENMFQTLGIPYRMIDTCTGDLGGPAYRKFDLEAWMPGRDEYGEVTSASNCTDYQARRLGIRCKGGDRKGTQFVHTLNGTAVAATRAIIAILENYQQADGSVIVPKPSANGSARTASPLPLIGRRKGFAISELRSCSSAAQRSTGMRSSTASRFG